MSFNCHNVALQKSLSLSLKIQMEDALATIYCVNKWLKLLKKKKKGL